MASMPELREKFGQTLEIAKEVQRAADADGRDLTDEECVRIDEVMAEHDAIGAQIAVRERIEKADKAMTVSTRVSEPQKPERADVVTADRIVFPSYTGPRLRAFRARKGETDREAYEKAYRTGMWCRAVLYGDSRSQQWCQDNGFDIRALSTSVTSKGGAVVPDEMDQAIIDLREEYGVIRQYARVVQMGSDHIIVPRRTGGVTAYAIGENTEITASDKSWNNVELTARKWGALTKYSSELAEDAIVSIADDLAQEFAYAFAEKEDDACWNGDGTSTYNGVLGVITQMVDGSHAGSYYTAEGAANSIDVFSEITTTTLAGVMAKLPAYAMPNAKWYTSSVGKALVFDRLSTAAGGNTRSDLAGGAPAMYGGFPIVVSQKLPAGASTDYSALIMLLFGDLSKAVTMGNRRGTTIRVSADRFLEYDQLGIVGTTRFDIVAHDVGDSSTAGPIVGLLGN